LSTPPMHTSNPKSNNSSSINTHSTNIFTRYKPNMNFFTINACFLAVCCSGWTATLFCSVACVDTLLFGCLCGTVLVSIIIVWKEAQVAKRKCSDLKQRVAELENKQMQQLFGNGRGGRNF